VITRTVPNVAPNAVHESRSARSLGPIRLAYTARSRAGRLVVVAGTPSAPGCVLGSDAAGRPGVSSVDIGGSVCRLPGFEMSVPGRTVPESNPEPLEALMYIGVGTVLLVLIIVLLVMTMRRRAI
jgi:hypothetical protein